MGRFWTSLLSATSMTRGRLLWFSRALRWQKRPWQRCRGTSCLGKRCGSSSRRARVMLWRNWTGATGRERSASAPNLSPNQRAGTATWWTRAAPSPRLPHPARPLPSPAALRLLPLLVSGVAGAAGSGMVRRRRRQHRGRRQRARRPGRSCRTRSSSSKTCPPTPQQTPSQPCSARFRGSRRFVWCRRDRGSRSASSRTRCSRGSR
mmetsp:Transcript_15874/g.32587  ORF Transcript_15874/g.32587 Transcript_15874/m.32587 type:complete len:206 (+) Transcript_15874:187-804(+)